MTPRTLPLCQCGAAATAVIRWRQVEDVACRRCVQVASSMTPKVLVRGLDEHYEQTPLSDVDPAAAQEGPSHANPQSKAAAKRQAKPPLGGKTNRGRVLKSLYERDGRLHPDGMSDDEVETMTGMLHQAASAARKALVDDGWVRPVLTDGTVKQVTRPTRTGSQAGLWTLSRRAREALNG